MHLYIMNALDLQQQKRFKLNLYLFIPVVVSRNFCQKKSWKQNFALCLHFDQLFVYIFRIWLQPQQQVALESGLVLLRAWRASHTQLLGSPCRLQLQIKQPTVKPFPQRKYIRVTQPLAIATSQCENFRIFQPLSFYVKSIFWRVLELKKVPFFHS